MRHIDDTHLTERDSQAERREQKNAPRAQAVENVCRPINEELLAVKRSQRLFRGSSNTWIGLPVRSVIVSKDDGLEFGSKARRSGRLDGVDRSDSLFWIAARQIELGQRGDDRTLNGAVPLARQHLAESRRIF